MPREDVELGHETAARNAATIAMERGMTIGHQLIASMSRPGDADTWREHRRIDGNDSDRVDPEDRRAYNGVAYSTAEVRRAVTQVQSQKTGAAATQLADAAGSGTVAARPPSQRALAYGLARSG